MPKKVAKKKGKKKSKKSKKDDDDEVEKVNIDIPPWEDPDISAPTVRLNIQLASPISSKLQIKCEVMIK